MNFLGKKKSKKISFNNDAKTITEAFGFDKDTYNKVSLGIVKSTLLEMALGDKDKTSSAMLEDYLNSKAFKELGISLESTNGALFIGYVFRNAITIKKDLLGKIEEAISSGIKDPKDFESWLKNNLDKTSRSTKSTDIFTDKLDDVFSKAKNEAFKIEINNKTKKDPDLIN